MLTEPKRYLCVLGVKQMRGGTMITEQVFVDAANDEMAWQRATRLCDRTEHVVHVEQVRGLFK